VPVTRRSEQKDADSAGDPAEKTLGELARLLNEGDGDIACGRGENHLFFDVA
jgi:hypothetical protein